MLRITSWTISAVAGAALSVSSAFAEPKRIGGSDIWGAFAHGTGKNRTCFVHGLPKSTRGKYKRRGGVYIQIAHRPATKVRDEVSVTAGYTYKPESKVTVHIDGKKFLMFTKGGKAWVRKAEDDRKFVRALIRGSRMVVRGRSSRNTLTIDTYSLKGFTKAYRRASQACNNVPTS